VKLTQLGLDIDRELCIDNMSQILERAKQLDIFVRIDMESTEYTERTLDIFKELHDKYGNLVGIVIQSYLHRSAGDIEMLIERGARVRLCKGAYAEPPELAFQDMKDVRFSFVALMKRLVDDGTYPAIATHDDQMIEKTLKYVNEHDIPVERYEFQMLYGVRRDVQRRLRSDGYNVRVYVPFGSNWYPYLMRRMAERSSNVGFMARSFFKEMFARK
jgi:proline dehydrogenase